MSKVFVTGGSGFVGSRAIVRLLAAGREIRTMLASGLLRQISTTTAGRLDTVAGCEYLDDRIRLPE